MCSSSMLRLLKAIGLNGHELNVSLLVSTPIPLETSIKLF